MIFELLATIAVLSVMIGMTWTMVDLMTILDRTGVRFVPAAWITTIWGVVSSLAGSIFLIDILRDVFGQ
jgi:uncharacterized membrane protein HdeD (DUF308 family)